MCPYNKAHEILVTRWDNHLIKCRKQHPNSGIVICKYVWSHHIPKEEIKSHEKECAKREINVGNAATAEPTFEIPDPLSAHRPGDVVMDPEWEEEVEACTLRRPNAENGPVETLETQNATGPRSSVLRNLSLNSTSSVRTTSGESAYDKYLRMEMAQEK